MNEDQMNLLDGMPVFTAQTSEVIKLDWDIAHLLELSKSKQIDYDNPVQRGYVWSPQKKSRLIRSVLKGIPISDIYLNRRGSDKIYESIDGKQRGDAIESFVDNKFGLIKNLEPIQIDGVEVNIARMTFNQLDQKLQNRIYRYRLMAHAFEDMSIEEKVEFFTLINSGTPMTKTEIARIRVKSRKEFLRVADHEVLKIMLTVNQLRRGVDEDIIENIWLLSNIESPNLQDSFRAKTLATTEMTREQEAEMQMAMGYLQALCAKANSTYGKKGKPYARMRNKVHMESIGYLAVVCVRYNISVDDFVDVIMDFFNVETQATTKNEEYNVASKTGLAKPGSVQTRLRILKGLVGID